MREPRNLDEFDKPEHCASWLESLARDIRKRDSGTGKVLKVELTLRYWHPSWKTRTKANGERGTKKRPASRA